MLLPPGAAGYVPHSNGTAADPGCSNGARGDATEESVEGLTVQPLAA